MPLYSGLGSKQQNIYQLSSNLSGKTLFAVSKVRQFFSQSELTDELDPLPC